MLVKYQSQYRGSESTGQAWLNAGLPVSEQEAKSYVKNKPEKYIGHNATHRILKITEEVVIIDTEIKFKETK